MNVIIAVFAKGANFSPTFKNLGKIRKFRAITMEYLHKIKVFLASNKKKFGQNQEFLRQLQIIIWAKKNFVH